MQSLIRSFFTFLSLCAAAFLLFPYTSDYAIRRDAAQLGQGGGKWKQLKKQTQEVPAELRAAIEQTHYPLQRDGTTSETSYLAPNPAQGWRARFDSDGLNVETSAGNGEGWRWVMRLKSYGYGQRVVPVERTEVAAASYRAEYRRGSVVEWYINERRGMEQGFTVSEPPAVAHERAQGEPLSLRLAIEGDLHAELSPDRQSIGFVDAAGQPELLYDHLMAFDARGRELPSRMRVEGGEVVLEMDDTGASYPLTVDPLIQQQKLTASDAGAGDLFGISVSLSGDTAIVGAYRDDNSGGVDAGSAYVFIRSGGVWTQQQKLMASDAAAGDFFGFSVSVSGDTAMIGSINDKNSSGVNAGSAYVFTRSGGVWTQQQRLQPLDVALNDQFGRSISISGETAVISSVADDNGGDGAGSAYVFTRSNGVWTQQQWLQALDAKAGANFGHSVSLDGDTVIIGAWQDTNGGWSAAGAAYVFIRSSGVWTQQQKLTIPDAVQHDFFGTSVSLSGDTAIVGAPLNDGNDTDAGAAYVFTRNSGVWTQQQRLHASDFAAEDYFGASISVSGNVAVVSASLDNNSGGVDAGSVYVFTRSGGVWTEQQRFQASDGNADDSFGNSVSLSGDTVIVGAYQYNNNSGLTADAGSAYIFVPTGPAQPCQTNVAASLYGATATASSTVNPNYPASGAIDGNRSGSNWGTGTGWNDATAGVYPDNLLVNLGVTQSISEIDVYSLQDNYTNPIEPTDTMTFNYYGLTNFQVQVPDGVGGWTDVPGGHVSGNNKVKRRIIFASPISTNQIRVLVNNSADGVYSRIVEVEAFSCSAVPVPTPTPTPTPCATNVAAASYGATASASSTVNANYPASGAIDGNHTGAGWGTGVGWNDGTPIVYPDSLTINLNTIQQLSEIDVYSLQDNYTNPSEPTGTMTFTQYGLVDFQVQVPDGAGGWTDVEGGLVSNNNLVKRRFVFTTPISTDRIRVVINNSADGVYSRVVEVEAFSCSPQIVLQSGLSPLGRYGGRSNPSVSLSTLPLPIWACFFGSSQIGY